MKIALQPGWAPQTIAATGQHCAPGVAVEVDDDLGASLCEQADKWCAVKESKPEGKTPDQGKESES